MPENPLASTLARSAIAARTHRNRQRLADAGRVAAQEIELQLGQRLVRNLDLGEVAEAGVDPVGGIVVMRELVDDLARGADARTGAAGQLRRLEVVGDRDELLEGE